MTNTPSITFQRLQFRRNNEQILNTISGHFYSNRITALIGPSGAGKTTLLKMLNGLLSPDSGEIFLHNQSLHTYPPTELRTKIGIALQDAPIIRGTVYDNLSLPYRLKNQTLPVETAITFLQYVGLSETLLTRAATELSGGQRQRLSLARTLLNQPSVLLLDEITSALDPTACAEIEALIQKITYDYELTTIWITHNSQQALLISDDLLVMNKGEIMLNGPTKHLLETSLSTLSPFIEGATQR